MTTRKIHVDPQLCEGHGLCVEFAPEVFHLGGQIADYDATPDESLWEGVDSAVAACPRHAITIVTE
ncbi:ferredoxin [Mycolicibacterium sphagni]|uniref:ferredoxin n=1 Tax=Mycolicibacterium sphagni TaxID=1786 RepID=UPI0021F3784A|nr:ferredoxin [Mycolicibacterium sphagni]MCV7177049.1 ferredoxin [Mycolicibacterium sphagni]